MAKLTAQGHGATTMILVLASKSPALLDFHEDLRSLEAASKIQLKSLAEEMQAIIKGLERVKLELGASENDGPVSDVFRKGRNADALALYFGEDPVRCPFEQVTVTLLNFVRLFRKANEENCKQVELEKKKAQKDVEMENAKGINLAKSLPGWLPNGVYGHFFEHCKEAPSPHYLVMVSCTCWFECHLITRMFTGLQLTDDISQEISYIYTRFPQIISVYYRCLKRGRSSYLEEGTDLTPSQFVYSEDFGNIGSSFNTVAAVLAFIISLTFQYQSDCPRDCKA
ncbi:actin binding protein [Actinidia rufa]|uniref:Actin binding protein n=1 Tax=Actinidia rufa TaxID=165716 RepID=A0A7J0GN18_9ERIC|nr:actin binding protein [Actinidia rufa]